MQPDYPVTQGVYFNSFEAVGGGRHVLRYGRQQFDPTLTALPASYPNMTVLAESPATFTFAYYQGGRWRDSWSGMQSMPSLVRLRTTDPDGQPRLARHRRAPAGRCRGRLRRSGERCAVRPAAMMQRCRAKPRASDQRGLALISVLWVLMVIAVLMTGFGVVRTPIVTSRSTSRIRAAPMPSSMPARTVPPSRCRTPTRAIAGIRTGRSIASRSRRPDRDLVADENGKIDINTAPEQLLLGLLAALGIPDDQAQALSDAVQDWRDPDDLRRLHGAEREEYRKAGRPGPANELFANIAELTQVLGMTPELYSRLAPFVTVYSGRQQIDR